MMRDLRTPFSTILSRRGLIKMSGAPGHAFALTQLGARSASAATEENVTDNINIAASSL